MRDFGVTSVQQQNCKDYNFDYVGFGDYDLGQPAAKCEKSKAPKRYLYPAQGKLSTNAAPSPDMPFSLTFALANHGFNSGSRSAVRRLTLKA